MPWLSTHARAQGLAALTDVELLPDEAAQDRAELGRTDVRSLVTTTLLSRGEMFGSVSAVSTTAGPWPEIFVDDLRLLNSAITSRIMLEHSRRALAEAIDAGAEAQLAYQQFFGSVGHELRTPLSSVLGYTEVLLSDAGQSPQDPVSAALLRDGPAMVRACEQVLTVVDHLLGTGRALSSDDQKQDVILAEAVADVVHWHRNPARAAGVEMHVDIDPGVTAWAHPSGVRQVLAHLLGNAIKHHRNGAGEVHLTTQRLRGESGLEMVRVLVRDDGPGIDPGRLGQAAAEGRLGVVSSITGRIEELGGTATVQSGSWGTEWELAVPLPAQRRTESTDE
jgi:signal transduction histidine kinase